jgi:tellurite resistance protein
MKERLQYFPVTLFSVIMGLSGLTIVFSKLYHMQWMPDYFYNTLLFFTSGLFMFFLVTYGLKAVKYFDEVKSDFNHRIRINFFSAISISFLLLSIAFIAYWPFLSMFLWWVGVILHTLLMLLHQFLDSAQF